MHVKELIIKVVDTDGNPVEGVDARLVGVDETPRQDSARPGFLFWRDVYVDSNIVAVESISHADYDEEILPEPMILKKDRDKVVMNAVLRAKQSASFSDWKQDTKQVDEDSIAYSSIEEPYREFPGAEREYFEHKDYGPRQSDLLKVFLKNWMQTKDRQCDLCAAFRTLADAIDPNDIGDSCDDAARTFLENIHGQMALLSETCAHISFLDEGDYFEDDESLFAAVEYWERQLADLMTAYKGLYDLILLEGESGQIPSSYLDDLKEDLERPFVCYQCMQKINTRFHHALRKGPLGAGLEKIADESQLLVEAVNDLLDSLHEFDAAGMPVEAAAHIKSLESLRQDIETNDRLAASLKSGANSNLIAQLEKALSQADTQRQTALGLIVELRENIRLQRFPQGWRDRANWLAEMKVGLKAIWEQLMSLVSSLRDYLTFIRWGGNTSWIIAGGIRGWGKTGRVPTGGGGNPMAAISNDISDMREAMRDIATFSPTKNDGGGGGIGGVNGDGGNYARRVAQVYTAVTGQPLARDPRTFRTTLRATFPADPATGQIARDPVRSVVSLYSDSGAAGELVAAQGTLRQIVNLVIVDAHKVLNGLRPIGNDTDEERVQALTAIVRHSFDTLADEAGRVDRPRQSLIIDTFDALLPPGGFLADLRDELDLSAPADSRSNPDLVTTTEAQIIASMDLLDEYAQTLFDAFDRFFLSPTGQDPRNGSFSGRAAYVTLLFSVVAQSVRELLDDMSAVGLSAPERRTTFITDPVSATAISVDGIFSWTENVMLNTGPRLLADSGLIGLNRVELTIRNRIAPLVNELLNISRGISATNTPAPHPGLTHSRVRNALVQLTNQIAQF